MKAHLVILVGLLLSSCAIDSTTKKVHDTIIIGGGLMGSSTAWHLSDQGNSVLLLEKQDSVYTQGSSFGEARIARSSNRGNDIWSYLHNSSVAQTQRLIDYLQSEDESQKYKMEDLYTTSPVTYVGRTSIYDKLYASLIRQNINYKMAITPEEGLSMFDVVLPDSVLIQREYNDYSGTLNPQRLITYLQKAVLLKGNEIRYNSIVIDLRFNEESDVYELKLKDLQTGGISLLTSKNVITSAGPYTGELLRNVAPYFDSLITPKRVFLAFLRIRKDVYLTLSQIEKNKLHSYYPVINSSKGTRDGSFFSMIEYFDSDNVPVIKIGGHFQRSEVNSVDDVWTQELSDKEIEWSMSSTLGYFKLLKLPINEDDIEVVKGYSCIYSLTDTEVPFVTPIVDEDLLPNERCVVLGGMSGVGAKGAMTYGLIAADILNHRQSKDSLYNVVSKELGVGRIRDMLEE